MTHPHRMRPCSVAGCQGNARVIASRQQMLAHIIGTMRRVRCDQCGHTQNLWEMDATTFRRMMQAADRLAMRAVTA